MADLEGTTLDRYELRQLMGQGGMADVYLAYDPHFERDVAVKIFKRDDEDLLRRFVREARLMASLSNAHLMPVFDTGVARFQGSNLYYIVMPYMAGGTLRGRVRRSPLSLKDACQYMRDIADALDYMHQQGIIHRDIKSSNILLDADGHCYLADFGIARTSSESTQMTSTGNVLGTVDYIAPELFETDTRANERSDYYSLGVLLYEMVTGQLPFTAENQIAVVAMHVSKRPPSPRLYVPDLPPAVELVMMKALEKRPALRYATATELATAFCRAITARSVPMPASNPNWNSGYVGGQTNPRLTQMPVSGQTNTRMQQVPPPMSATGSRPIPTLDARSTANVYTATGHYPVQQPAYQPSPQPPRRSSDVSVRAQTRIVTFLAILALLAVVGPMVYVALNGGLPFVTKNDPAATATPDVQATSQVLTATAQQQGKDATATAQVKVTATAQAQAQAQATAKANNSKATAQAQATATVKANAQATPGVYQTAIAGAPAYEDVLNNADSDTTKGAKWDQSENCSFQSDGYHVTTNVLKTFNGCRARDKAFRNFAAQVDVVVTSGNSGGLFFRLGANTFGAFKGYLFEVDRDGNYRISVSDNFNANATTVLRDWTPAAALKKGTEKNTLQVIAKDDTLLFYANGAFLDQPLQDGNYADGNIGFLATAEGGQQANVVYSNVRVVNL